ncbi:helicase HerA domain-containing protein [Planotetraspora sp. GP83]|uniref:helicase HerA domain-containing protein n=1 Tax=Planotetraspora sp. GP83 TaxID=3156264 RepID=UPI003518378D
MTAARDSEVDTAAVSWVVTRLPAQAEMPVPGGEPTTVENVLRDRLTEFLSGMRHADPVTLQADVRRDPDVGARVTLRLSGRAATVAGHASRCADLLAGLVDLAALAPPPITGNPAAVATGRAVAASGPPAERGPLPWHGLGQDGAPAWRVIPGHGERLPGRRMACWPGGGLRWAALLDAVERAAGPCGVRVSLTPAEPPRAVLPVLRRAVRRSATAGASRVRDEETRADDGEKALDALEAAPVAFHVDVAVAAGDPATATELAAALGAHCVPEDSAARRGVLDRVRDGSVVAPETAAALVPVAALPMEAVTRHARRPAVVARYAPAAIGAGVRLGRSAGGRDYLLRVADLSQHLLVTGLTGFGKTTTVMTLLRRLWRDHGVPYLVIDPEKTEYLGLADGALRLGHDGAQINPLAVPDGVSGAAFGDTVAECLDAATGLSVSWPFAAATLRNAVTDVYQGDEAPTVATLYRAVLDHAGAYGGAGEQAANLRASLGQRVQSLVAGAGGDALAGGPHAGLDWGRLLAAPAVITLADFGDRTARQLAFALLLAGLVAYRRAHPLPELGHLAVLEEAHLLLGGVSHDQERTGSAAAEATATAISTQRSYGQGFVLVTQSPRQLPEAVTRLFPNRLTHRLAEEPGEGAIGQVAEQVPMLGRGEAFVVDASGHPAPVWVSVDPEPARLSRPAPVVPANGRPPERIWCAACPNPCAARHWLRLLPQVEAAIAGVPQSDQARLAVDAVGAAFVGAAMRPTFEELHAGVYCVTARALTRSRADDRRGAAAAQREARVLADRVAADTRQGQPNRGRETEDGA